MKDKKYIRYGGTKDSVIEESKKYKNLLDLKLNQPGAYEFIRKHNLKDICFPDRKKIIWTRETVLNVLKECTHRKDLRIKYPGAYAYALSHNMLDDFYEKRYNSKRWTRERVLETLKRCKSVSEFRVKYPGGYMFAWRMNMLDEIHPNRKSHILYTDESVLEISKQYKSRTEFSRNKGGAYQYACKHNLLDKMTWLVDKRIDDKSRIDNVYSYEIPLLKGTCVYVGRTINPHRRHKQHMEITSDNDSIVRCVLDIIGLNSVDMKVLETDLTIIEGCEREQYWLEDYQRKGYHILNSAKTGRHSGSKGTLLMFRRSLEETIEYAKTCRNVSVFIKGYYGGYKRLKKLGLIDQIFPKKHVREKK